MENRRSHFTHALASLNSLDIGRWVFEVGMGFGSLEVWWGGTSPRRSAHSGMDIVRYETPSGLQSSLSDGVKVPAAYDGVVAAVIGDIISSTVILRHLLTENERLLCTLYAHIYPSEGMNVGDEVHEGWVIGYIAPSPVGMAPPHLHLGAAYIPERLFESGDISWKVLESSPEVEFIDPIGIITDSSV